MTSGISRLRQIGAALLVAMTGLIGVSSIAPSPAAAAGGFSFTRFAGENRFDTSAKIAVGTFGTAPTVLLARGDLFPDALAGNYLAGSLSGGAPVLLTRTDSLPAETDAALKTLATTRVIILGGPAAVSTAVEAQLRDKNLQVERAAGDTRFDTAQRIAERQGATNVGSVDNSKTAILASGRNFPDALAGGPLSYASKLPTLITEPNTLSPQARSAFTNLAIRQVLLLGGPAAVAPAVEDQVKAMGITVVRLQGANRQETATKIAQYALDKLAFNKAHANLARGDGFADALSGGPHGGKELSYILLTLSPTVLSIETRDFLNLQSSTLTSGHIFGGLAAVSAPVEQEAQTAGQSGRASITVASTKVPQGGKVTGNVAGQNIQTVTVGGCGIPAGTAVNRDGNGAFTLQLPTSQGPGNCTLTFVTTFTDGTTETDIINMTIDPIAKAVTNAPELLLVEFVRTVQSPNGTSTFPQSTYRFTFDENITGQAPAAGLFTLYRYDRIADQPNTFPTYTGRSAVIDPSDNKSVLVVFGGPRVVGDTATSINRPVGADQVGLITTGGVKRGAVADDGGTLNPEGAAPTRDVTFNPGRTAAPDLVSVGNFRPNFDSTRTLADFTFDQPAWVNPALSDARVQTPGVKPYWLVLSTPDSGEQGCFFVPAAVDVTTSGNGTKVHTVSCDILSGGTQLTATNVARGVIDPKAVAPTADSGDGPSTSNLNPLQSAEVATDGATTRPDLVSVDFQPDVVTSPDASPVDRVVYTFDEAVFLNTNETTTPDARVPPCGGSATAPPTINRPPGGCFVAYRVDGSEVFGRNVLLNGQGTNGSEVSPIRSGTNPAQVIVNFPSGTLADATGASVRDGAVTEAVATGGVNRRNFKDEVEATARTIPGGRTNGPDLVACRTEGETFDAVTGAVKTLRLVYTFDEEIKVDTATAASEFPVYDLLGRPVAPVRPATASSRSKTNRQELIIPATAYDDGATTPLLRSAVACGIHEAVVSDNTPDETRGGAFATNPVGYQGLLQAPAG
jgi:putative cell wall-binding protein